jgi:methyl-accepting chemotaxis protein
MATVLTLPRGARLTQASWRARLRIVLAPLWLHVPAFLLLGPRPAWEAFLLPAGIAAAAGLTYALPADAARATPTSVGLIPVRSWRSSCRVARCRGTSTSTRS